jgi:hypothetical protein
MGLLDSIFGGGSQTRTSKPVISQTSKDLLNPSMDAYKALFRYQAGIPQTAAFDQEAQGLQNAGLNDTQRQALQMMQQHAQGGFNLGQQATGALGNLLGGNGMPSNVAGLAQGLVGGGYTNPAMAGVSQIASGAQNGQNPYLDATYQQAAHNFTQAAVPALTSQFANAGRTGSNSYASALGSQLNQGLGNLATNIYGGGYATDRANQMSALGMQGQLGQQNVGNMLSGAGLYNQGQQQQLQGIALGGTAYGLGSLPAQELMQAGTTQQQAPYNLINGALAASEGYPMGQSSTSSSQMNPLTGMLGLGASGLGMAGMLGAFGTPIQNASWGVR